MSDYKKIEKEITIYCIAFLLFFIFALAFIGFTSAKDVNDRCKTLGDLMRLENKYVKRNGCFLKHDGNWIHKDNLRIVIK